MRIESSVTAITWLPFAALDRLPVLPIGIAVAHYDEPPGEVLGDLDAWRDADRFREANQLQGWIEVENGEIVGYGRGGRSLVTGAGLDRGAWGSDSARPVGPDGSQIAFPAIEFPVIRPEPEVGRGFVRLQQTVGGRIGFPVPRPLRGRGYFHIGSAQAWTTLELVIRADGSSEGRLVAASPFPHHSVYDSAGAFVTEQGLTDFDGWYREWHDDSPWDGDELEDELDRVAVRSGAKVRRRRLDRGETLVEQGEPGAEMYLLLDGVLDVEIDGEPVAGVGSGAVLGELAVLGDGRRTATVRAGRPSRVAVLTPTHRLAELALARRQADRR
jgi:Cyclic nucleotide-binding domain